MPGLGYLAVILLLIWPLVVATAAGSPPPPERPPPTEHERASPGARATETPHGEGSADTAHPTALVWHIEMVDSAGHVGTDTSLALDADDYPHISYYDSTYDDLKYAHFDGTDWHIETVDSGWVGRFSSLALDPDGHPHISYWDQDNADLLYAFFDGTSWHVETVDTAGEVGLYTSLALDTAGQPHISYCSRDPETGWCDDLRHAWVGEGRSYSLFLPLVLSRVDGLALSGVDGLVVQRR